MGRIEAVQLGDRLVEFSTRNARNAVSQYIIEGGSPVFIKKQAFFGIFQQRA